jgi:hypothetical protein
MTILKNQQSISVIKKFWRFHLTELIKFGQMNRAMTIILTHTRMIISRQPEISVISVVGELHLTTLIKFRQMKYFDHMNINFV